MHEDRNIPTKNLSHESFVINFVYNLFTSGYAVAQLVEALRYTATSRKVAGSIPDGVIGIFH